MYNNNSQYVHMNPYVYDNMCLNQSNYAQNYDNYCNNNCNEYVIPDCMVNSFNTGVKNKNYWKEWIENTSVKKYFQKPFFNIQQIENYIKLCDMDIADFNIFFLNVMDLYILFRVNNIKNKDTLKSYFDDCQFLYLLELLVIVSNKEPLFHNTSLFKVHDGVAFVDYSCIYENGVYRVSNGSTNEPFRGYELFIRLDSLTKMNIINKFFYCMKELKEILKIIINEEYPEFNPEEWIFIFGHMLLYKSNYRAIDLFANEFSGKIYELSFNQRIELFRDIEQNKNLWSSRFFKHQARLRYLVMFIFNYRNLNFDF